MEAMILAAGIGTRLRPLTDTVPKALVPVRGRPLLAHVLDRVVEAGATRVIVNTHHHAAQVRAWLEGHRPLGVEIALSHEPDGPYDTGGGFLAAAPLFHWAGPILLHNVDVLSRIPLADVFAAHQTARAQATEPLVATLAVQDRPTSRWLLFDDRGLLGRERLGPDGAVIDQEHARTPVGSPIRRAFAGIHIVNRSVWGRCRRTGTFSMIDLYLDLVREGQVVRPMDVTAFDWLDVGTPQRLAEAEARWL
jgi:NDP-sugar pyrophosphorylase family protein